MNWGSKLRRTWAVFIALSILGSAVWPTAVLALSRDPMQALLLSAICSSARSLKIAASEPLKSESGVKHGAEHCALCSLPAQHPSDPDAGQHGVFAFVNQGFLRAYSDEAFAQTRLWIAPPPRGPPASI